MRTIKVAKRTQFETVCKAMAAICKRSAKGVKETLSVIHYSATHKRLEATDGRVLLVYSVSNFEESDRDGYFIYQGGFLIEEAHAFTFPECERVIPEPGKTNHKGESFGCVYDIKGEGLSRNKDGIYADAVCILGYLGFRFIPDYIEGVRDLLGDMTRLSVWSKYGEAVNNAPFVWSNADEDLKYVVMPIMNEDHWAEFRQADVKAAEKKTA